MKNPIGPEHSINRPLPSYLKSRSQSEAWCTIIHMKMSLICMWMKSHFRMKGWAPRLALRERLKVIRKWPSHNSLWAWHDKCNICCRYCIYHVKFNVCLVTKPLGMFSSETEWLNVSLLFLRMNYMCKCIIKQLLNSVFAWYHELSKPRVYVICRPRFW